MVEAQFEPFEADTMPLFGRGVPLETAVDSTFEAVGTLSGYRQMEKNDFWGKGLWLLRSQCKVAIEPDGQV